MQCGLTPSSRAAHALCGRLVQHIIVGTLYMAPLAGMWVVADVVVEWLQAHRAVIRSDPGSGSRRAIWKTPVRCNITGALFCSVCALHIHCPGNFAHTTNLGYVRLQHQPVCMLYCTGVGAADSMLQLGV